ncbi:hypothetical protein Gotur_032139 [Gossypium turneri]
MRRCDQKESDSLFAFICFAVYPQPKADSICGERNEENSSLPSMSRHKLRVSQHAPEDGYRGAYWHCKTFYTEEDGPHGDNCTFLYDEQSKNRESVAMAAEVVVGMWTECKDKDL